MSEIHKCKNCNKNIEYDKEHCYYHTFCSKECQMIYNKEHCLYSKRHYCLICGKPAKFDNRLKRWRKTCCSRECLKQVQQIAQKSGVKNRNKLNIQKEELYNLFIVQNKSRKEVANYFNCSEANIKKMCRIFGIIKKQKDALRNTYDTKMEKYGNPYYTNNDIISNVEKEWLDKIGIPDDLNHRQVVLGEYRVDGFEQKTNTIYEFLGDYWHGNPNIFNLKEINKHNGLTMSESYKKTIERFNTLKKLGYKIIYIWESDYKKGLKPKEYVS